MKYLKSKIMVLVWITVTGISDSASTRLVRETNPFNPPYEAVEDIAVEIAKELLDEERAMKILAIVTKYLLPNGARFEIMSSIRDFLKTKMEELTTEEYKYTAEIIVPTILAIFGYNFKTQDPYEQLVVREPEYKLELEIRQFPDKLSKAIEDVKSYVKTWNHSSDFLDKLSREGLRALLEIACVELGIDSSQFIPRSHARKSFVKLKARTLRPVHDYFRESYEFLKQLNALPKTKDEWIERFKYVFKETKKISSDIRKFVPPWAQRKTIEMALIEIGSKLGKEMGMDYYDWEKLFSQGKTPTWRITPKFLEFSFDFLDGISLEGLWDCYEDRWEIFGTLELYPPKGDGYAWMDYFRWYLGIGWERYLPRREKKRRQALEHLILRIAQEKDISLIDLNANHFYKIKFLRKPEMGENDKNLSNLVRNLGWDYLKEIIEKLEEKINSQLNEIEEKLKGRRHIFWQKYYLKTLKRFVDRKLGQGELLKLQLSDIRGTVLERMMDSLFPNNFALFKATLYIDYNLLERITTPFNTVDYLLGLAFLPHSFEWDFSEGALREIRRLLAKYKNKAIEELSEEDYVSTRALDLLQFFVEKDPFNFLSPEDKKLFEIAIEDNKEKLHKWTLLRISPL